VAPLVSSPAIADRRTPRPGADEPTHVSAEPAEPRARGLRAFWQALGPGLIVGAADDDPSGIATYSVAGAQLGPAMLWTALLTWPLMAAVQSMCARIGMVTGQGLAAALHARFPRPLLATAAAALLIANTLNLGADLSAMADAAQLLTGVNSHLWVVLFGVGVALATVRLRYAQLARTLKWLALALFVYVAAAFYLRPDWSEVAHATFIPSLPRGHTAWQTLVAILGTTISPYLFFWQASQEVEEEKAKGHRRLDDRIGATPHEIRTRKVDIGVGSFFSNAVMFFIILTTWLALNRHGVTNVETSQDVAAALEPLAGRFASLLYAIGILGTGALAIPTLAGSAAYALAETFGWHQGIDAHYLEARAFYAVIVLSFAIGVGMNFANVNAVQALYWSAVLNGLLAPFLLLGILLVASDRVIMQGQPSSLLGRLTVGVTTLAMIGAALAMFR
jgi:NRAMP (natural resistance-associated macrophage protein)-like metal ion transporter